jgi:flagellar biosynthesis/type III secretory pathway chaperone
MNTPNADTAPQIHVGFVDGDPHGGIPCELFDVMFDAQQESLNFYETNAETVQNYVDSVLTARAALLSELDYLNRQIAMVESEMNTELPSVTLGAQEIKTQWRVLHPSTRGPIPAAVTNYVTNNSEMIRETMLEAGLAALREVLTTAPLKSK